MNVCEHTCARVCVFLVLQSHAGCVVKLYAKACLQITGIYSTMIVTWLELLVIVPLTCTYPRDVIVTCRPHKCRLLTCALTLATALRPTCLHKTSIDGISVCFSMVAMMFIDDLCE